MEALTIPINANMACDRFSDATSLESNCAFRVEPPSKSTYSWRKAAFARRFAPAQTPHKCRMPVQIANVYSSSHMPSFPPTLEEELDTTSESQGREEDPSRIDLKPDDHYSQQFLDRTRSQPVPSHSNSFHFQRDSASTTASDSTSSSPTTTASLAESFNNTETPITSPDTPASTQSLSSPSFTLAATKPQSEKAELFRLAPAPRNLSRPSTSHKKPRNLKGLAVDTSSASTFGRSANTASLPIQRPKDTNMLSAPASPAFVKPPNQPKRKGSSLGLSIVPPSSNSPPVQQVVEVPPTPSLVKPHALRHFPSSPALPLASPSAPPEGGMQLPPLATRRNVNVGFAEAPQEKDEDEPNFDVPQSAEPKQITYPDGPICIYDPHVYLYYEPSAEQASQFDVILNVASEVRNPFTSMKVSDGKEGSGSQPTNTTSQASSPSTPKAINSSTDHLAQPNYVHIPWEHNTDIVPDLYDLVRLVDERVQEGKKVLIHCQCGVSRSASLIVAYGLYKNPSISVQEAYDAVKRRSKWICPNMNLIMQLQEFRSALLKQSAGMPARGLSLRQRADKSKNGPLGTGRSAEAPTRTSQDFEKKSDEAGPRSAPLIPDENNNHDLSITTSRDVVTPGPSSAPSGYAWPTDPTTVAQLSEKQAQPRNNSLPTSSLSLPPMSAPVTQEISSPSSQASIISSQPSLSTQPSSSASPDQSLPPPNPIQSHEPFHARDNLPTLKSVSHPLNHVSRFHALNQGSDRQSESPRSAEFAMNPAKPPTPDETFGLTSPRVSNFQSLHNSLHPSPVPAQSFNRTTVPIENEFATVSSDIPQRQSSKPMPIMPPSNLSSLAGVAQDRSSHEPAPSLDSLTSPRSSEFAMTGIGPPKALQNDDGFGLTSPRENLSFASQVQLPQRSSPNPQLSTKKEAAFASLHSPTHSVSQPHTQLSIPSITGHGPTNPTDGASDRRKLRSKLGMSTSSSYDMRSEFLLAAKARELAQPLLRGPLEHRDSFHQATQDDMAEALMSPRATEFTRNPFADALGLAVESDQQSSTVSRPERTEAAEEKDPRSPVQKAGSSPIVRNIADVFS